MRWYSNGAATVPIHSHPSLIGLTISKNYFSLSATTTQSLAAATAAIIVSSALLGRALVPASAMNRAHVRPAFSSNERTRPANRACGPSGPANQALSASRFRPFGIFKNAAMNFSDSQRGDKEILIFLLPHPGQQRSRRLRLDDVSNDVGIKKVACHRSTLRSFSRGRLRSRSAPTSGERRSAASTAPVFGGSPLLPAVWFGEAVPPLAPLPSISGQGSGLAHDRRRAPGSRTERYRV